MLCQDWRNTRFHSVLQLPPTNALAATTPVATAEPTGWEHAHLSVGEDTPPEAMTLMQCAPLRSSSRAAALQASGGVPHPTYRHARGSSSCHSVSQSALLSQSVSQHCCQSAKDAMSVTPHLKGPKVQLKSAPNCTAVASADTPPPVRGRSPTPSQTRPRPRRAAPQLHTSSPRPRMSPWPPVWLSACPACWAAPTRWLQTCWHVLPACVATLLKEAVFMKPAGWSVMQESNAAGHSKVRKHTHNSPVKRMEGPSIEPSSTASAMPQSAPPAGAHQQHDTAHGMTDSHSGPTAVGCKLLEAWPGRQAAPAEPDACPTRAQRAAMCSTRTAVAYSREAT